MFLRKCINYVKQCVLFISTKTLAILFCYYLLITRLIFVINYFSLRTSLKFEPLLKNRFAPCGIHVVGCVASRLWLFGDSITIKVAGALSLLPQRGKRIWIIFEKRSKRNEGWVKRERRAGEDDSWKVNRVCGINEIR